MVAKRTGEPARWQVTVSSRLGALHGSDHGRRKLMALVRRPLGAIIVLYAGAVTLDRVGEGAIGWWVFVLAAAAAALALTRSGTGVRPVTLAGVAMALYVGLKAFLPGEGISSGSEIYIATIEAGFVVLTAVLAAHLAAALASLDRALGSVAFGDNPALPLQAPQAGHEILTEMARSRRHERPLTVTVLAPEPGSVETAVEEAAEEVQRVIRSRFVRGKLSRVIAGQLRRSDILFEDGKTGHYLVVSPETGDDGAALLVTRIKDAAGAAGLRLDAGIASFPDHAVSFEHLVELAERRLAGDESIPPRLRAITTPGGST
jgi:hypothetical protein